MKKWEIALNKFLDEFKKKHKIIGAIVCGSFVTGTPTKHSDIDVQLILPDNATYRERGNKIINGFLIEYYLNSKDQITKYFESDYNRSQLISHNMFLTGKILFDDESKIKELQKEAKKYFTKGFKKLNKTQIELQKYTAWDMLDNLQDAYESNAPDFVFSYHNALRGLFEKYIVFLRLPITHYYKFYSYLTNTTSRKKYLQKEFPDKTFANLMTKALIETEKKKMLNYYEKLTKHFLTKTGGFEIDGWKIRNKSKK